MLVTKVVCVHVHLPALAAQCLHNFRTTIRYGGRKNVPSKVEVEALTVSQLRMKFLWVLQSPQELIIFICIIFLHLFFQRGRNTKRQMCILPGGMPVVLNVRSSSVSLLIIKLIPKKSYS